MQRTGIANLPLHPGKCPKWLFERMIKLSREITNAILLEYNQEEFLTRLADPYFFQAFGCTVGFDWHSSGVTTTLCGALKLAIDPQQTGIKVAGGKRESRKAPTEIEQASELFSLSTNKVEKLKYSSKMAAKVDTTVLQDNYNLYQHSFIFTEKSQWVVIQQGLNPQSNYARRYHWLSDNVKSFVEEPHNAICCDEMQEYCLDLTSNENKQTREVSLDIVNDNPQHIEKYFTKQRMLTDFIKKPQTITLNPNHNITNMKKRDIATLEKAYELQPKTYEELVSIKGVGPKTIRSLALISDLVYGSKLSWKDPTKYAFAHGGKDGIPYPVNRKLMDQTTSILKNAVYQAKLGESDKLKAIRRLKGFY